MASSASSRSSKGHKDKDPNQPDYEKIVLTEKYKTYIKEIDNEQQKWIDYKNQIRRCRNSYMEASSIFQGKIRNRELKRFADEFHSLSDKIPEKMEAVTKVGGNPLPLERHLMALPSMGPKKGKK